MKVGDGGRSLFSVFTGHVIKTNNSNHSINKVKNLGYDRRLICKQAREELGLWCFSFARYSEKGVTQIVWRRHVGALQRGTNMVAVK